MAVVLDPDLFLKATSVLVVGTLAALTLAGSRSRAPNVFLAAFLFLIAGNQIAEITRGWIVQDPAAKVVWFRIATVFASLDPFFLYYFASVFPSRNALGSPWRLAAVGGAASTLALTAVARGPTWVVEGWSRLHAEVLLLFTFVVYLVVLVHFLREHVESPTTRTQGFLFTAACLATLPLCLRVVFIPAGVMRTMTDQSLADAAFPWVVLLVALGLVITVALAAGLFALARRRSGGRAPPGVGPGILAALALTAVIAIPQVHHVMALTGHAQDPSYTWWIGRAGAAIRWEAFSLLAAAAVVRHDTLGVSLAARRRAARVLVALAVIAAAGVLAIATARGFGAHKMIAPWQAGAVLVAVVLSQGFRSLVNRIAEHAYGVPRAGDAGAGLVAYRRAVEQAVHEGRPVDSDPELTRLRRELGIDAQSAAVVADMARDASDRRLLTPGRRLEGRYRVVRLIGRGGTGRVLLGRDEAEGRDVVLKEIPKDDEGSDDAALSEARIAGSLAHPHIVRVLDVVERAASTVLVTEYVPGGSLAERVQDRGRFDAAAGVRLLDDVLAGLEAAHAARIVHRDVKPANVLLDANLRAKVADFGLARVQTGETLGPLQIGAVAGTWAFMAPEQRRGESATRASDVHAVGLLARACIREPLPPGVERVVSRALEEDPAARYADAGAMRRALREAVAGDDAVNASTGGASGPRRSRPPSPARGARPSRGDGS